MSSTNTRSDAFSVSKDTVRQIGMGIAAVIALAVIVALAISLYRALNPSDSLASAINSNEYQGVFLSNGQVYFGKLTPEDGGFYYLRHVYYLSSQASPQSGKKQRQYLIHLGNEIHGPEDLMVISRAQILFVENLKPSGEVSRTIAKSGAP